jgi:isopentenyldiphosphate isomerase
MGEVELVERVDERDRVVAVVDRAEAIRNRWPHRIATAVCRDPDGRILVHQRASDHPRFPGQFNWLVGGAAGVGESYQAAAAREIAEELGVQAAARLVLKYLCQGAISPYWLGLHEATITQSITPDPAEIAWHAWLTASEFRQAIRTWAFVPDAQEAYGLYCDVSARIDS